MLIRYEMKYNNALVYDFEQWIEDSYPDDHWMLDKVWNDRSDSSYWEYKSENVEEMFDIWLNVLYQQSIYKERFKDVEVDYKY